MASVEFLLAQLKSPDQNRRYEACKLLRVTPVLPNEALDALEQSTHDTDRLVAEAAQAALTFHKRANAPSYGVNSIPPIAAQARMEGPNTILSRVFSIVAIALIVLGITTLPFMNFRLDGVPQETASAIKLSGVWIILVLSAISLFFSGKKGGWLWLFTSAVGIVILVTGWSDARGAIIEAASHGFIGKGIQDVLTGNTPVQKVEGFAPGDGLIAAVMGLVVLAACGLRNITRRGAGQ